MTHDLAKNRRLGTKLFNGMAYVKCLLESNRGLFSEVKMNKKIKCQLYQRANGLQPTCSVHALIYLTNGQYIGFTFVI